MKASGTLERKGRTWIFPTCPSSLSPKRMLDTSTQLANLTPAKLKQVKLRLHITDTLGNPNEAVDYIPSILKPLAAIPSIDEDDEHAWRRGLAAHRTADPEADDAPEPIPQPRPLITCKAGEIDRMVRQSEAALLKAKLPIYQRSVLVRPAVVELTRRGQRSQDPQRRAGRRHRASAHQDAVASRHLREVRRSLE